MSTSRKTAGRSAAVAAAALTALALAGTAAADREKIQLTAAGQAAARAVVLTRDDLAAIPGWKGGSVKPDLSSDTGCAGFDPKQSDLVVNGAASTNWTSAGLDVRSEAQVLKTPAMVALDWGRTVTSPQVIPCLRSHVAKSLPGTARLVSLRRIAYPRLGTRSAAFRVLVDVTASGTVVRVLSDIVVVGLGRNELTLSVTAPAAEASVLRTLELRWLRVMLSRASA